MNTEYKKEGIIKIFSGFQGCENGNHGRKQESLEKLAMVYSSTYFPSCRERIINYFEHLKSEVMVEPTKRTIL